MPREKPWKRSLLVHHKRFPIRKKCGRRNQSHELLKRLPAVVVPANGSEHDPYVLLSKLQPSQSVLTKADFSIKTRGRPRRAVQPANNGQIPTCSQTRDQKRKQRVCHEKKATMVADSTSAQIPDVQKAVQDLMTKLFITVYNYKDEDGRCYSNTFAELPEDISSEGLKNNRKPISFDWIKQKLDKGQYRRMDHFQKDMFSVCERAQSLSGGNSQLYKDSVKIQQYFIKTRDEVCKYGEVLLTPALNYEVKDDEIMVLTSAEDASTGNVNLVTCNHNVRDYEQCFFKSKTYKLGDSVYVQADGDTPRIVRIERIWSNKPFVSSQTYFNGTWFVKPADVKHSPNRLFFRNEVFRVSSNALTPMDKIIGKCSVLSLQDYCSNRITEIAEKDVFICESEYDEEEQTIKNLNPGLTKYSLSPQVIKDEIYFFMRHVSPDRISKCHANRQTLYQRARILSKPSQHSDRTPTHPPCPPIQTFFVYPGGGQSLLPSNTDAVLSSDGNLCKWQMGKHGRLRYTTCNSTNLSLNTNKRNRHGQSVKSMLNEQRHISEGDSSPMICDVCYLRFGSAEAMKRHRLRHFNHPRLLLSRSHPSNHIEVDPASLQCPNNVHIEVESASLQCPNNVHKDLPTLGDKQDAIRSSEPLGSPPGEMSQDSQLCVTADVVLCDSACVNGSPETGRELRDSAQVSDSPETGREYKCPLCSKVFTSLSDIRGHVQLHLNEKSFKCDICCKEYYSRTSMVAHRRLHFIPSVSNTHLIKSSEKSRSLQRFIKTYDKMVYKCKVCPRGFTNEFSLRNHANDHIVVNPGAYVCSFCGKQFKLSISLTAHMNSHMRKRQCELSNKKHTLETTVLQAHALGVVEQQKLEKDGLHSPELSVVEQETEMDSLHSPGSSVVEQEISEMDGLHSPGSSVVEQEISEMDSLHSPGSSVVEQEISEIDSLHSPGSSVVDLDTSEMDSLHSPGSSVVEQETSEMDGLHSPGSSVVEQETSEMDSLHSPGSSVVEQETSEMDSLHSPGSSVVKQEISEMDGLHSPGSSVVEQEISEMDTLHSPGSSVAVLDTSEMDGLEDEAPVAAKQQTSEMEGLISELNQQILNEQQIIEKIDKIKAEHAQLSLYKCNDCPREFTNEFSLRKHANDHIAAYPGEYVCSFCGKQFKLSISLTAHMKSHMRKRQCELSNKKHTLETTVLQAHALGVVEQETLEIDGLHSHGSSVVEQETSEMDGLISELNQQLLNEQQILEKIHKIKAEHAQISLPEIEVSEQQNDLLQVTAEKSPEQISANEADIGQAKQLTPQRQHQIMARQQQQNVATQETHPASQTEHQIMPCDERISQPAEQPTLQVKQEVHWTSEEMLQPVQRIKQEQRSTINDHQSILQEEQSECQTQTTPLSQIQMTLPLILACENEDSMILS